MTIGELAAQAGVNVQTVRYYERRGLLPEPKRTPSGYRRYEADAAGRLRFIQRAKRLGFTLHEIAELLSLSVRNARACEAVGQKTRAKVAVVRQKIVELRAIERSLHRLVAACDACERTDECPILASVEECAVE